MCCPRLLQDCNSMLGMSTDKNPNVFFKRSPLATQMPFYISIMHSMLFEKKSFRTIATQNECVHVRMKRYNETKTNNKNVSSHKMSEAFWPV